MPIDLEKFKKNVDASLVRTQASFEGKYKNELGELLGLPSDKIAEVTPGLEGQQEYSKLISVVEEASRMNVSQATLRSQIKSLGENAVQIAKMVGGLAALFA
jgi:hypothetical protein